MVSAYPGAFYPGQVYPSQTSGGSAITADQTPQLNVRLDVAFTTTPMDANPAWVDLTSRVRLSDGLTVRRGRQTEYDTVQTGTLSCTLENIDAALTPDNSSSVYSPNVLPQRRIRLTYRDPSNYGAGNLLAAEDASFEGGTTGSWQNTYFGAPASVTIANSTTHPSDGTKGMVITYPTAGAGASPQLFVNVVKGRTYTMRAVVWVGAGVPAVKFGEIFAPGTVVSTTTGASETLTVTFTATTSGTYIGFRSMAATTAGQQVWVDSIMIDEGSSLGAFTTTAPAINPRFEGFVDEWPVIWPTGGDNFAASLITAGDLLAWIGTRQKLSSVVTETLRLDSPAVHYPLDDAAGSLVASDVTGAVDGQTLPVVQFGAGGGSLTFASGTGPPTDGAAAAQFAPASTTNGKYLTGPISRVNWLSYAATVECALLTSASAAQVATAIFDDYSDVLSVETDATGHLVGRFSAPLAGVNIAVTSASTYNNGQTHNAAATLSTSGSTVTLTLIVNGVSAGTATTTTVSVPLFQRMSIGGIPGDGKLFTGTISHAVAYGTALTTARLADHRTAQTTGFAGERSDQRIARIASWAGLPASRLILDVGNSTSIAHVDPTGGSPLDLMRTIEQTEAGLLFADRSGNLVFYNRARSYTATAASVTIPAQLVGEDAMFRKNLQLVRNDITGKRDGGATVRAFDQASKDAYGTIADSLQLATTSDQDVRDAVTWELGIRKDPQTRFESLTLDAATDPTTSPQVLSGVQVGTHVQITGLPSQAPSATLDQIVQGYTETIDTDGWSMDVNATPYLQLVAFVLNDATYGVLDGNSRLVY